MTRIPKIIHYCWFGNNLKPESVLKYIENWKNVLPDYEIIEWNESNFDINVCDYVKQAYEQKKFAFVSDYARLYALYNFGGVYLDTDVEIYKDLEPLLNLAGVVFGFEEFNRIATSTILSEKGNRFIHSFLKDYHTRSFIEDGKIVPTTNVEVLTEMLVEHGLIQNGVKQNIIINEEKLVVLEQIYLSPLNYSNRVDNSDYRTFAIHRFEHTWGSRYDFFKKRIKLIILSVLGLEFFSKVKKIIK